MARRTFAEYKASVVSALGGEPSTGIDKAEIVNDALQWLASMHPWHWRRGGPVLISLTGPLTITDGTWTEGTLTLTKTGAFTNYTFNAGDRIVVSAGTGATAGTYQIASRTSNDAIVLSTSIGSGADGQTDIDAEIQFPYVPLPSDFGEEYEVQYPGSFTSRMIRTSLAEIERMRALPIVSAFWGYFFAVNTGQSSAPASGLDTPRLEIYPTPTASVPNAISLTYLRNIRRFNLDTDTPQIPTWMDYALDLACRAFAYTVEDDDPNSSAHQQLQSMLPSLMARDGQTQHRLGVMNGGLYPRSYGIDPLYPRSIGDPTYAQAP